MDWYILEDRRPVRVKEEIAAEWFASNNRVLKQTEVAPGVEVSTVFLGLDHNFGSGPDPILFETMIFGGKRDMECDRYSTWSEAMKGHAEFVLSFHENCAYCGKLRQGSEVQCTGCGANLTGHWR